MTSTLEHEYIFQEILEQPVIARRHLQSAPPIWPTRAGGRTIVTGAGDSHAAAELLAAVFPDLAIEGTSAMAGSRAAVSLVPGDALLGISVSGRTTRVIEATLRARAVGATTVAITDDPSSPLARESDQVWLIDASPAAALTTSDYSDPEARSYVGYHHDVAQTKTFLAVLLRIGRAADQVLGTADRSPWGILPETLDALTAPPFYAPLLDRAADWSGAGQTFFLAGGPALPLARFACYKMYEFNREAHFTDIEEYCHTHYFITRPGDAVVFLIHDAFAAARAAEIAPVLRELFGARIIALHPRSLPCPAELGDGALPIPTAPGLLAGLLGLLIAVEWVTYLTGRIGAPNINTFHAGHDTEKLVAASGRTIRASDIRPLDTPPEPPDPEHPRP